LSKVTPPALPTCFGNNNGRQKILLKDVKSPQRFGASILQGSRVVKIEEKPANPRLSYAVTGMYYYDAHVFDIIKTLKPDSLRDVLPIPSLLKAGWTQSERRSLIGKTHSPDL
jgi:dTDP-glucose pyrophosphorylase